MTHGRRWPSTVLVVALMAAGVLAGVWCLRVAAAAADVQDAGSEAGGSAALASSQAEVGALASATSPGPAGAAAGPAVAAPRADAEWVARQSEATGIGPIALRAYADATLALQLDRPGCRLGWTTLAGVGAVESAHGTSGDAVVGDDGRPSPPIVGPALDGSPGLAAIPATPESTAWHGDPVWEHAVGPLQMLPSTWRRWGSDGDGDGVSDPNDLDDAALAAGRYLCAAGGDLSTSTGWTTAVLAYNHDDAYVARVRAAADAVAVASRAATG